VTTGGQEVKKLEVPRFICVLAVLFGGGALVIQAGIDIYQSLNPKMDWPSYIAQAWQMTLPTGFAFVFAGFAGGLWRKRTWGTFFGGALLYVLATAFLIYTATNSMDFMANATVTHTHAQLTRQSDIRAIMDKQSEAAKSERKELVETLFRTYTTAKTQTDRDKALLRIQETTQAPVTVTPLDVEVVQVGSGGILNRWFGWRPEAVIEAKAISWPILSLIGKAIAVSLGVAFWPASAAAERWRRQLPTSSKLPDGQEIERKLTKQDARNDLIRMAEIGAKVESGRELADRWGVTESCVSKWLRDFRREGIIKRERHGKFMAVQAVQHVNGNGRVHA
jgi:hypothetical protein